MTRHLFDRLRIAAETLTPVESQYRVVAENPSDPDGCCVVLVPDPNWMAAARAGNILPPLAAYDDDQRRMGDWLVKNPGREQEFSWDKIGGARHPYATPIGPMTEEQAIEYLIMKDLPRAIWDSNRPRFKIVRTTSIPTDRSFRNAWRLAA